MAGKVWGFDWDEGNWLKCQQHGVSVEEIEELFAGTVVVFPDREHRSGEKRFRAVGKTKAGRYVFVVFTQRVVDGQNKIRPISARYMHRKEVESYEKENPDISE